MSDGQSALVVAVPDLDPVVGSWRSRLDTGAILGVPAHVTILYPFMPPSQLDAAVEADLSRLFLGFDAFEVSFDSIAWFGDMVAYVRPTPDTPLRQLTAAVAERWPDWRPYEGAFEDTIPHLTISDTGRQPVLTEACREIATALPLRFNVTEIQLFTGTEVPGSWRRRRSFPLASRRAG